MNSTKNFKKFYFCEHSFGGGGCSYAPIKIITNFGKKIRIKIEDYDSKNTGVF